MSTAPSSGPNEPPQPALSGLLPWFVVTLVMLLGVLAIFQQQASRAAQTIAYSELKELVRAGRVEELVMRGRSVQAYLPASEAGESSGLSSETRESVLSEIPSIGDDSLLPLLEEHRVLITVHETDEGGSSFFSFLPLLFFIAFFAWFLRRASKGLPGGLGPQALDQFLQKGKSAQAPETTFDDVAGQRNAKREVQELIDFLRDPSEYQKLGAEVPKGVLLMGPPGTGKTLLARALAGEAGVPFFSISASEFIEMFVGVGASRVRNLFQNAKKRAPSIIFIDELDSIGRVRGAGLGGGHDEREQTLNQILAEMDGFEGHEAVIVLAATNRPDVLDPALLRPGRFDRHVVLDLPDRDDRAKILAVHTRKVPLADDVDMEQIASTTPGFSGADLKNLVNEAALSAAHSRHAKVTMSDLDIAKDKLILGVERTLVIQPDEKHRLAVHEAGHTVLAYFLTEADPPYKVSIIPRGRALGGTHQLPEHERHTLSEEYLKDRLCVMLAGRAAEKELVLSLSSGADDDIHQATRLARSMVARWGMAKEIGPVDLRLSEEHPFLGREMANPRQFSEASARAVDAAVHRLLTEAEERALRMIREQREQLVRLVEKLEEKETLYRHEIDECLNPSLAKSLRRSKETAANKERESFRSSGPAPGSPRF